MGRQASFQLEFYATADGREPVREWLRRLRRDQRRAVGAVLQAQLERSGVGVCGSEFGKQLGGGVFEFRARLVSVESGSAGAGERGASWSLLVRILCHAYGNRVVLLLAAYDKRADPSRRRQQQEIALARLRLTDWQRRRGA